MLQSLKTVMKLKTRVMKLKTHDTSYIYVNADN